MARASECTSTSLPRARSLIITSCTLLHVVEMPVEHGVVDGRLVHFSPLGDHQFGRSETLPNVLEALRAAVDVRYGQEVRTAPAVLPEHLRRQDES